MNWNLSWRADPRGRVLADKHYSRQSIGAQDFVKPGRCVVLLTSDAQALWVTSWPFAQYVKHAWAGAWENSLFRRESGPLASELIREAIAVTRWMWPDVPPLGIVTFIDEAAVRHKRDPGRCYKKAGFTKLPVRTKTEGFLVYQMKPEDMPEPEAPMNANLELFSRDEGRRTG